MPKIAKIAVVLPKPGPENEKAMAKCFEAMADTMKDIETLLSRIANAKPLAAATLVDLKKREAIAKGRAAEMKDMAKDRARGQLHSNPAKLARVYKDLNEDVAQANWLEGGIAKALDEEFGKEVVKLAGKLAAALPKGVTIKHFPFEAMIKTFRARNAKEGWVNFDANARAFEDEVAREAAAVEREQAIRTVVNGAPFATLRYAVRQKVMETALKSSTATAQSVTLVLQQALDKQRKPSKSAWAKYLDLGAGGGYELTSSGSFESMKIHLTMSKDSWTGEADGRVSVFGGNADQVMKDLLEVTDWKQLHATLEVSKDASQFPHVYLFAGVLANDKRWAPAAGLLGRDAAWITRAQAALTGELTKLKTELRKKIAEAIKQDGANVI